MLGMHKTMSRPTTGAPLSGHEGFGTGPPQKPTVSVLTGGAQAQSRGWEHDMPEAVLTSQPSITAHTARMGLGVVCKQADYIGTHTG